LGDLTKLVDKNFAFFGSNSNKIGAFCPFFDLMLRVVIELNVSELNHLEASRVAMIQGDPLQYLTLFVISYV
jgi:hypothetical protein